MSRPIADHRASDAGLDAGASAAVPACAEVGRIVWLALWVPLAGLLVVIAGLAFCCHRLLQSAAAGAPATIGQLPLLLVAAGFVCAGVVVVAIQFLRVADRLAGPEYRLRQALQRIRAGDVGFRVALRQGDLLVDLARDTNDLLEWLRRNPPAGVCTGGGGTRPVVPAPPGAQAEGVR